MIVSASRRTDIPAFYGNWFLQKVQEGSVAVKNPFSQKSEYVSLKPQEVGAFVFWSKNYAPFLPVLEKIAKHYHQRFLFHYTINALPEQTVKLLEPKVPDINHSMEIVAKLAQSYGAEKIIWRFDPIIFSNQTPPGERLQTFAECARNLQGLVQYCMISFIDLYGKVCRRFQRLDNHSNLKLIKPTLDDRVRFARQLKYIARRFNMAIYTCCEDDIARKAAIPRGHCIDVPYLRKLFSGVQFRNELRPTRDECGCYFSRDIGQYNTCRHDCLYCYAKR